MNNVITEAIWFSRTSLRNRMRLLLSRVKSPRYAVAMTLGILYFGFIFVGPLFSPGTHSSNPSSFLLMRLSRGVGGLGLALLAASWWTWRSDSIGISLSPAEANLLVPAPITRRQLIQFKLLRSQPQLMLSALFVALMTHGSGIPVVARFIAAWILVATLMLHRYGASLVHTTLTQNGKSGWRRVWLASLLFAAMLGAVLFSLVQSFFFNGAAFSLASLSDALAAPPAAYALAPFRAVLAPLNAPSLNVWPAATAIAALLLALHYIWVIRTDAAFEESAAAAGVKRAAVVEAARAGRTGRARELMRAKPQTTVRTPWFPLAASGEPAVAILWKNALAVTRGASRRMLAFVVPIIVLIVFFTSMQAGERHGMREVLGMMALGYAGIVTVFAPSRIRHDFRNDLLNLDLVKTLPVGGLRLAAAQITTSATLVTLIQAALAGTGLFFLISAGVIRNPWAAAIYGVPVVLAVIALNASMVAVHNWFALKFPAWVSKPGGIEMFGTVMATTLLSFFALILLLIVPGLTALSAFVATGMQWGSKSYIPPIAGALVGLFGQLVFIVSRVGVAYDNLDPIEIRLIK
jgi:hypothetical protein